MTRYQVGYTANTSTCDLGDWREQAVCRDEDAELFFPVSAAGPGAAQTEVAKAVCRRCPVVSNCLSWALDHHVEFGVWGGMSEDERRALTRPRHHVSDPATAAAVRRVRVDEETGVARIRQLAAQGLTDQQVADQLNRDRPAARWSRDRVAAARYRTGIESGYVVRQRGAA